MGAVSRVKGFLNAMVRPNQDSSKREIETDLDQNKIYENGFCTNLRPNFLELEQLETEQAGDRGNRLVICPKNPNLCPFSAGYAEVINAGKTLLNEDQASCGIFNITDFSENDGDGDKPACSEQLSFEYFGIFDGHAGNSAAVLASEFLHRFVAAELSTVVHFVKNELGSSPDPNDHPLKSRSVCMNSPFTKYTFSIDALIKGALQKAFYEMDDYILLESNRRYLRGGCAVIIAVIIDDRLYIANAGDCRALLVREDTVVQLSHDHTPISERCRLQQVAYDHPELLFGEFSRLMFTRRVLKSDVGKLMPYRDYETAGWSIKEVTIEDTRLPMINGTGKAAKLLSTIGVTRGLGDHKLTIFSTNHSIKPFLSSSPEVTVCNASSFKETDILVLGCDGLWDVLSNQRVGEIVRDILSNSEKDNPRRFINAAKALVTEARGCKPERASWQLANGSPASFDDISCFVIPLCQQTFAKTRPSFSSVILESHTSNTCKSASSKCFDIPVDHKKHSTETFNLETPSEEVSLNQSNLFHSLKH